MNAMRKLCSISLMAFALIPWFAHAAPLGVQWRSELNEETFKEAKKEKKLVLLDLEAVWCHWCHVMEEKTYSEDSIRRILQEKYLSVRIDQDSRPDIANRFREYGWPATIIFNSDGEELEKLAGYVEARELQSILEGLASKPERRLAKASPAYSQVVNLSSKLREELGNRYHQALDKVQGGLNTNHKYLDRDTMEFAFSQISNPEDSTAEYIKKTLDQNLKLVDPVWGGVYQYSTGRDWEHPHFEKIAIKQADNLRLYSLGYGYFRNERYLQAIKDIRSYLQRFLKEPSSGAFYASQDADVVRAEHAGGYFKLSDIERTTRGLPKVDTNIYASENGRLITALVFVYAYTKEQSALAEALAAAKWIFSHRQLQAGGFRHGEVDGVGPFLCDTLEMANASLALYSATGDRSWLEQAKRGAAFIVDNFVLSDNVGFVTSKPIASFFPARPIVSENIDAVRFFASLLNYSGDSRFRNDALIGIRLLGQENIALESISEVGIILADNELSIPPLHIAVVGSKNDSLALQLFQEALFFPAISKRTEWWDRAEGPMPNADLQYPVLGKAAAFVCTNQRCSLPIFNPSDVEPTIRKLRTPRK